MCGIAGLTAFNDEQLLKRMIDVMRYRGPDEYGQFCDRSAKVGLAMCRLSIIDLAGGQQPMANEDHSVYLICNGEIYNSPQLREDLLARGHQFRTHNSDVEVILHLYEECGTRLLAKLNGMFAFVLFDRKKRLLFAARDRMGIKPFYYAHQDGRLAFASELKSLLLVPWIRRTLSPKSLGHYLSLQYVPAPQSIFADIQKLPAGHFFIYDLNKDALTIEKYWQLSCLTDQARRPQEWRDQVSHQMTAALQRWTLSDVPLACSLSGGLDSASLVGLWARCGIADIRTYSLGFEGPGTEIYDELALAKKVSEKWGTRHTQVILNPERVLNDLDRMIWHLDEPYAGGLPSWYIYELIGRDVKVALTGTGGDELFGNYGKYQVFDRSWLYRFLKTARRSVLSGRSQEFEDSRRYPFGHFYPLYFSDAAKKDVLLSQMAEPLCKTEALIEEIARQSLVRDPRSRVAFVDFKMQLPEEFLLVTDRFSMAHSVEARVPFLDHELVELVFQMPPGLRAMPGEPKGFLKSLMGGLLPPEVLMAPKRGFVLPLPLWIRGALRPVIEELLSPAYLKRQGLFCPEIYQQLVVPHMQRRRDFTQQIWTLLMFQKWYERFAHG